MDIEYNNACSDYTLAMIQGWENSIMVNPSLSLDLMDDGTCWPVPYKTLFINSSTMVTKIIVLSSKYVDYQGLGWVDGFFLQLHYKIGKCIQPNWKVSNVIKEFIISPNPVNDNLSVLGLSNEDIIKISIKEFSGKIVLELVNGVEEINVSMLQKGYYIMEILMENGDSKAKKFLKK